MLECVRFEHVQRCEIAYTLLLDTRTETKIASP